MPETCAARNIPWKHPSAVSAKKNSKYKTIIGCVILDKQTTLVQEAFLHNQAENK